jgi:tetratricopeptide (TPR) repeat protein
MGLAEEAAFEASRAVELIRSNPAGDAASLRLLGSVHRELEQYDNAVDAYRRAVDLAPYNMNGVRSLGNLYRILDFPCEAAVQYRRAAEIDSNSSKIGEILDDLDAQCAQSR